MVICYREIVNNDHVSILFKLLSIVHFHHWIVKMLFSLLIIVLVVVVVIVLLLLGFNFFLLICTSCLLGRVHRKTLSYWA